MLEHRDIWEIVHKKLGPKERVKMRLVFPKTMQFWKPHIDKKLSVVNNYINKNKTRILQKNKKMSSAIYNYIKNNPQDDFINSLGKEIGIHNDIIITDECLFMKDIMTNDITLLKKNAKKYPQELVNLFNTDKVLVCIYSCNVDTFIYLYDLPLIKQLLSTERHKEKFLFGLINHQNESLLKYVLENHLFDDVLDYLKRDCIAGIFLSTHNKIKLLIDNIELPKWVLLNLLEKSEDELYEDTAIFLEQYIKKFDII